MEQVSFFRPPLWNTNPEPEPMTLREVWEYIRGDRAKYWTDRLRKTGDTSIKEKKLDFVTFGGVFSYRNTERLISPSGYLIVDIDHVSKIGRDIRELRDELLKDKELGLRLIFISPRGDGLKLVCESSLVINTPEDFKSDTYSLLGYIHETHKIPYFVGEKEKILDKDCTDIPRSCLLCHDPESVLVEEGSPFYSLGFDPEEHTFPEEEVREDMDKEEGKETLKPKRTIPQGIGSFDWTDFVDGRLVPAMFERIDEIFPDMDFHFSGRAWKSPLKLDGSQAKFPRRDKSVITTKHKGGIYEQGGETIGVIDFYMQRNGLSFSEARKELSRICGLEEEELELRRKTAEDLNKDRRTTNTMTNKENPTGEEKVPQTGKFDKYFDLPGKGELWEELARDPEGFKTSFSFGEGDDREVLTIPREGVTFVCGLSSHFKSTLLRNLALQMTEDETQGEGDVIFFSLEESTRKAKLRLLCVYSDTYFRKARDYAKERDVFKISLTPEYQVRFKEKSDKFEELLTSGRLRIYDSPDNVSDLVELLEEYRKRRPIKAVFIDFIQRLKADKVSSRTDEMRVIAETLQNYTKRNTIPVIVAAQLNRLTPSPIRMGANNIAESADLTRYAETIICLWGSQKREDVTDINFLDSKEENRLQELGFVLGTPGTIYAKITKNKEGESGIEGVLSVNGGTGRISQEIVENKSKTIWNK